MAHGLLFSGTSLRRLFFQSRSMTARDIRGSRKRFGPLGVLFFIIGVVMFAYFVKKAGPNQIADGIRNLGYSFFLIICISAIRQIVRSLAWSLCMEAPYRLRVWDAFRARVMGDAIGNVLPFASFVISEAAKPALIRDRVPLLPGLSAIAIENIFYSLSVTIFVFSGMTALLLSFSLPRGLRLVSIITIAAVLIVIAFVVLLIRKRLRFVSSTARFLTRFGLEAKWSDQGQLFEDRVYGFYRRNGSRFLPILLLEACFHLAGVAEIFLVLSFISPNQPPTVLKAFILESVNRVITMTFKFIPLRMGVDEAGTGKVSQVLNFAEATGVTQAIIRKARDVFWAAIGMIFLLQRGLSIRLVAQEAEAAVAEAMDPSASAGRTA